MDGLFSMGVGTRENPYIVSSVADLNNAHNDLKAFYKQGAHIDFMGASWLPLGKGRDRDDKFYMFTGGYDGAGYKIKNIVYKSTPDMEKEKPGEEGRKTSAGFIGCGYNCILENIKIENASNSEKSLLSIGGIIGTIYGGIVSGCSFSGTLKAIGGYTYYLGGIAGQAEFSGKLESPTPAIIDNCETEIDIDGTGETGGVLGSGTYVTMKKSFSVGNIKGRGSAGGFVGNLNGLIFSDDNFNVIKENKSVIDECFSNVVINLDSSYAAGFAGGVGHSDITNCYSTGGVSVAGDDPYCGGFAAECLNSFFLNCYAASNVSALGEQVDGNFGYPTSAVAGFAAFAGETIIENCFSLNDKIEARSRSNAIVGFTRSVYGPNEINNCFHLSDLSYGSGQSMPITRKEAKKEQTYINNGWDLGNKWYIEEGVKFPDFLKRSKSRVKCNRMFIGNLLGG